MSEMGNSLFHLHLEAALEWVLLLSVSAFCLCMLALLTMLIIERYRLDGNESREPRLAVRRCNSGAACARRRKLDQKTAG